MPHNPNMTDDDIDAVMAYVEAVYTGALGGEAAAGADVAVAPESEGLNRYWVIGGLAVALLLLIFILWNILGKLNQVSAIQKGEEYTPPTLRTLFVGRTAIGIYVLLFIILGGYFTVNRAVDIKDRRVGKTSRDHSKGQ